MSRRCRRSIGCAPSDLVYTYSFFEKCKHSFCSEFCCSGHRNNRPYCFDFCLGFLAVFCSMAWPSIQQALAQSVHLYLCVRTLSVFGLRPPALFAVWFFGAGCCKFMGIKADHALKQGLITVRGAALSAKGQNHDRALFPPPNDGDLEPRHEISHLV